MPKPFKPTRMIRGRAPGDVSRATAQAEDVSVRVKDLTEGDPLVGAQTSIAVCAIARRTGFMLRTLLTVWEAAVRDNPKGTARIRDAIESAANQLVGIYAEGVDED